MTAAEKEYGGALYALAQEEHCEDAVLEGIVLVHQLFTETPAYPRLVQNPALAKAERLALLDEALRGGVHPYVLNFVKILCEHSALGLLGGCVAQFRTLLYEARGILPVTAVSAVALSEAQKQALSEKLAAATGKTILLETALDPAVMGGVKLRYAGKELDGTVTGRLAALRRALLNT